MTGGTVGLHHVTSIASDPQANVDFYTGGLGLRLVKRTVNFEDEFTYHLYYGDEVGHPGTVLTFFPLVGGRQGRAGRGQPTATAFVVPDGSVDYWVDRLDSKGVDVERSKERFGETVVQFRDHDGHPMELVTGTSDVDPWEEGPVPAQFAVRGLHGVTLDSLDPEATGAVLVALGYEQVAREDARTRYRTRGDRAAFVDVLAREDAERGRQGVGTVHHVAVRAPDEETQLAWRERLSERGLAVTPQKDRQYFTSIYVRDAGGILFEVATDGPGFTRDESVAALGTSLKLPPWLEEDREMLDGQLPDLETGTVADA